MHRNAVARPYAVWLWLFTALFVIRVIAQPLAAVIEPGLLPPFQAWQSGVMPYAVLASTQVVIIAFLCRVSWRMSREMVKPDRRFGRLLLLMGGLYVGSMIVRMGLGLTVFSGHSWFDRPLPTAFHFVLAGFMLLYGHFHFRQSSHA